MHGGLFYLSERQISKQAPNEVRSRFFKKAMKAFLHEHGQRPRAARRAAGKMPAVNPVTPTIFFKKKLPLITF